MSKDDLFGRRVANDGWELREALDEHYQIKKLEHVGNFVFWATLENGPPMLVVTQPVDLAMRTLCIMKIYRPE